MTAPDRSRVLHLDDEPDFAKLAAKFLQRHNERIIVETAETLDGGLELFETEDFDCIVSDYDFPDGDGIELLEAVRQTDPAIPFILYTGKGSEAVAGEAISAGVTDYLQKESGTSQYEVLGNRIVNAVQQHRTQHAIEATENRLQRIAANTNDILWEFTATWDELLFINEPYEEIWGRSIDELREAPRAFLDGIHPDDRPKVRDAMDRLTAGSSGDLEFRVNADEEFGRWVWAQGSPVHDDADEVESVVGFARDVTERKREARRFEALIEQSMDVITVADEHGTITYESPSVERVLGYTPDELIGEYGFDYVHPDDRDDLFEQFTDLLENPETGMERVTYRFKHGSGSWIWLETVARREPHPAVDGYVLNSRDVTERINRQQALDGSQERFRRIAESATDAIVTIDAESTILFANRAVERIFGHTPTEVEGECLTMLMPEDYRDQHRDAVERYLETGDRGLDWTGTEFVGLHQEGHELELRISFSEIEGADGQHRFTGIIREAEVSHT